MVYILIQQALFLIKLFNVNVSAVQRHHNRH